MMRGTAAKGAFPYAHPTVAEMDLIEQLRRGNAGGLAWRQHASCSAAARIALNSHLRHSLPSGCETDATATPAVASTCSGAA
jgi:hypothetical protein